MQVFKFILSIFTLALIVADVARASVDTLAKRQRIRINPQPRFKNQQLPSINKPAKHVRINVTSTRPKVASIQTENAAAKVSAKPQIVSHQRKVLKKKNAPSESPDTKSNDPIQEEVESETDATEEDTSGDNKKDEPGSEDDKDPDDNSSSEDDNEDEENKDE